MRKLISLLLMLWLPLFLSVASHAASQMQSHALQEMSNPMPAKHAVSMDDAHEAHCQMQAAGIPPANHPSPAPADNCSHCGFCFSVGLPTANVISLGTYSHPLVSHTPWVALPHTTATALRPPIVLN